MLVALVVLSPWAFGSVDPRATQAIALVSLAAALGAWRGTPGAGRCSRAPIALWPLAGLWLLAVSQLMPLPESLHRLIAPGSAAVWHPDVPAAAAVLGPGPRPISLHPEATRRSLAFATGLLALALAAAPALRERRPLLRASIAIVAGGVAVALYGLVARLVFTNKLYGIWSVPTIAPFGPFVSKNHFAGYVELTALLAVGLAAGLASEARRGPGLLSWIESSRARFVVAAWGAAAILVLAVPVCLSRGGVVSLAAGLVAFAGLRLWSRRDSRLSPRGLLGLAGGAALLLVALVSVLPGRGPRPRAHPRGSDERPVRLLPAGGVARHTAPRPLEPLGRLRFRRLRGRAPALQDRGRPARGRARRERLPRAAGGGRHRRRGLVAALAALVLTRGLRGAASHGDRLARGLATGATAGLVAIAVHSAFDFNLRIPSNALVCVALVAFVLAVPANGTARTPRLLVPFLLLVTLAVALLTPWAAPRVGPGPMLRAARSGDASLRRAGLEADLTSHLQRRPADAAAWLALAWLRFPTSRDEASALAEWAVELDPASQAVRERVRASRPARFGETTPAGRYWQSPGVPVQICSYTPTPLPRKCKTALKDTGKSRPGARGASAPTPPSEGLVLPRGPDVALAAPFRQPHAHEDEEEHGDLRPLSVRGAHVPLHDGVCRGEARGEHENRQNLAEAVLHGVCDPPDECWHQRIPD